MPDKPRILQGIGQAISDVFKGGGTKRMPRDKGEKPTIQRILPGYPESGDKSERIKFLAQRVYLEGSFEKVQFARKWMRNALMIQGYHDLEWSEINVAWDAIIRDSGDYAFPNNYYRSLIMYGAGMYVKNAPQFTFNPANDDFEAQLDSQACKRAFEVIKENVQYDRLRVWEAVYLRLFGNSFRYSYYNLDPRYGHVVSPVFQAQTFQYDQGWWQCPNCGTVAQGQPAPQGAPPAQGAQAATGPPPPQGAPQAAPACTTCGQPLNPQDIHPPTTGQIPVQTGKVKYPRGQEQCEIVSPMEVGVRSSSPDLFHAPYLYRARVVDRIALQGDFPNIDLGSTEMLGGEDMASAATGDLSLIYQQSLADLPGDPTQFAAWYERATAFAKTLFLQVWIRPSQYSFDHDLRDQYPDGIYAAIGAGKLLESKNESIDDHWVHFLYNPVPGRFWGDGDDDIIPKQLQLNESDRLILRNQAYASVPQLVIDSQRIDKDNIVNDPAELIECKITGRPVSDAVHQLQGQALPQETWQWRQSQLQDMQYHTGVFNSALGQHEQGVNTFGGQEQSANRAEQTLSPLLLMYKEANELWAKQVLKLAAQNWLDDRIQAVEGINGTWEFTRIRGDLLDLDQVKIIAKVIPIDYAQQQSLAQAVAGNLLNPQDPRVQKKALELYQLPTELNQYTIDEKKQWKEIESMKQSQQYVRPVLLRDNDDIHAQTCREWLLSDEADKPEMQQVVMLVQQHMQEHIMNKGKSMMIMQALAQMGMQAGAQAVGMPPEAAAQMQQQGQGQGQGGPPQQQQQGQQPPPQQKPPHGQSGKRGGQSPASQGTRVSRAKKANAAAANRPQPPSGNQYHVGPH